MNLSVARKPALLFLFTALLIPAKVEAQNRMDPQRVAKCHLADSLVPHYKADAAVLIGRDTLRHWIALSTPPNRIWRRGFGIRGITGSAQIDGQGPDATLELQLEIKLVEATERPIEQRQLALRLDDAALIELGSMSTEPEHLPNTPGVVQNMYIQVPAQTFRALANAHKAEGTIGATEFTVSKEEHQKLRALYIGAVCMFEKAAGAP